MPSPRINEGTKRGLEWVVRRPAAEVVAEMAALARQDKDDSADPANAAAPRKILDLPTPSATSPATDQPRCSDLAGTSA